MHLSTPVGRSVSIFHLDYGSFVWWRARAWAVAIAIPASGCSSHLDDIAQYNPSSLPNGAGTCEVRVDAPTAKQVFTESDDIDPTTEGVQIPGTLAYSGSNCKELRWGLCGVLDSFEKVSEMSGDELAVSFTLTPGEVSLCAQAIDARNHRSPAPQVAVEQRRCAAELQQCGSDPVCRDLRSDLLHCGECDKPCPTELHRTASCANAVCGLAACDAGYHLDPSKTGGSPECVKRPGCEGLSAACSGNDCCAWDEVSQNGSAIRFQRGYDASNMRGELDEVWQPLNDAARVRVEPFVLDRYEVTVGRFRRFLEGYDDWVGDGQPRKGYAQHPALPESGWRDAWTNLVLTNGPIVPPTANDFRMRALACGNYSSFTEEVGDREDLPINCVNFFEAFLFCMWDQARLPTEAEWNAAAASSEQRYYPWSRPPEMTNITAQHALYGKSEQLPDPVGAHPAGEGPFHSQDLAGNVYEWTRDSEIADPACKTTNGGCNYGGETTNPLEQSGETDPSRGYFHMIRGGSYKTEPSRLRTAHRYVMYGLERLSDIGFRCARPMVTH